MPRRESASMRRYRHLTTDYTPFAYLVYYVISTHGSGGDLAMRALMAASVAAAKAAGASASKAASGKSSQGRTRGSQTGSETRIRRSAAPSGSSASTSTRCSHAHRPTVARWRRAAISGRQRPSGCPTAAAQPRSRRRCGTRRTRQSCRPSAHKNLLGARAAKAAAEPLHVRAAGVFDASAASSASASPTPTRKRET